MCGRFADQLAWEEEWVALLGDWPDAVVKSYNKSPTQLTAAFTQEGGQAMRWGLVPAWSNRSYTRYATFNARVEEADRKPAFRAAWRSGRRCLIPVLCYYEWQRSDPIRQPYLVAESSGQPLLLGGLWEAWSGEGAEFLSCTILTREPVTPVARIHDRMPVVVEAGQMHDWLWGTSQTAAGVATADVSNLLEIRRVGRYVNNPRNDGPACIGPESEFDPRQQELDF